MKTQAHELTDKQKEYLLILAEECSEVIKVITKTFRFGLESKNPYIPESPTNKEELIQEIGDVMAMVELLKDSALELTDESLKAAKQKKIDKLNQWLNNKD
jgi:NTP pyrophosphatase (non-canonical NTP hydrolase)